jgi:hypothetical protein
VDEGLAIVDRTETLGAEPGARRIWHTLEEAGRAELPGEAPAADESAGLWGAQRLFFACQAVVCRELEADEVRPRILESCPFPRNPSVDYSVDVCLRHLPDVARLARQLAASDPVNDMILTLASTWPLSAAGIPAPEFNNLDSFWNDLTMRRLFVDRIIARQASAAMRLPQLADAVRAALGAYDEDLSPALAAGLRAAAVTP